MNQAEAASPPLSPLDPRRARLRTRPSGLKGRCRDRCATGLRSALDPGGLYGPSTRATTRVQDHGPARHCRGAQHGHQDQNPYNQVSTVSGDCHQITGLMLARAM
jgi:hypothetical protein